MSYLREYRCPHDNKLLFRGVLVDSSVEIKCRHCQQIVVIHGVSTNEALCMKLECPHRVQYTKDIEAHEAQSS